MSSAKYRRFALVVYLAILATGISGCGAEVSQLAQGDVVQSASVESLDPAEIRAAALDEQVAAITGRDGVDLIPLRGADVWLGGAGLAAYVDPETHDEFIVDERRGLLLSYDPGTRLYQDPVDLPLYPGEPSREEVLALADEWAVEHMPELDISTMRRTGRRRVAGSGPDGDVVEYLVEYRRYADGAKVPEWGSVTVTLPTWVWTPACSGFQHCEAYEAQPSPAVDIIEALDIASEAAGFDDYAVTSACLNYWKGDYRWWFELENRSETQAEFGQHGAWVDVDAMTGECGGASFCG